MGVRLTTSSENLISCTQLQESAGGIRLCESMLHYTMTKMVDLKASHTIGLRETVMLKSGIWGKTQAKKTFFTPV